ncbi:hypothetical protein [Nocardia acidivorans]|uniref:hypothetical protein n=1 Tax=Nocardia acidivorans TaxID=404580 RepID=UPI0008377D87|nr:hypothetical protein [Nocardia acidivorans]
MVDPVDIAAVAVESLVRQCHTGKVYTLSGPRPFSPGEQTGIRPRCWAAPLRFEEISATESRSALLSFGVTPELADAITALRATALESFTVVVHPTVEQVTGRPPRDFREWAIAHRAEFLH